MKSVSLSLKLIGLFVLSATAFVMIARYAVQWIYDTDYLRELASGHLQLHVNYVRDDIGAPPDIERAQAIVDKVPVDIRIEGPGVDWSSSPDFPAIAALDWDDSRFFQDEEAGGDWFDELESVEFAMHDQHRFVRLRNADYSIAVATPKLADTYRPIDPNIVVTVFGLGLLTCCYLGVRWLFNPIHGIQRGMRRIGRGDLDYRFHPTRSDEFGELTRDIDRLTERVQDMLDSKRELLLAISHEMRSPLTRMKLALEFDNDDAREALADDVAELETIIRELLEAERLNEAHVALAVSAVTPLELVHEVLAENFPGERVEMQQRGAARAASWDVTRIKLLLKNLIHNALKHGRGEGPVQVGVDTTSAEHVEIAVSDDGPGMPDEALARATEPFYRADPSRSRKSGGLGLGLYLASRVAEAHGGSLILARNGARGLKATAVLPNEPPSDDDSAG